MILSPFLPSWSVVLLLFAFCFQRRSEESAHHHISYSRHSSSIQNKKHITYRSYCFQFFFEKKDLNCRGATGKDKTRQTFALPHHLFARRQHSAHMKYEHRHKYYFQLVLSYLMIPSQNMHYSITVNIQATSNKKQHSIQPCWHKLPTCLEPSTRSNKKV